MFQRSTKKRTPCLEGWIRRVVVNNKDLIDPGVIAKQLEQRPLRCGEEVKSVVHDCAALRGGAKDLIQGFIDPPP
jgi:hypothetical protein